MDEIDVAANEFSESVFGVFSGVAGDQFLVGVAHVQKDNVAADQNPPGNLS